MKTTNLRRAVINEVVIILVRCRAFDDKDAYCIVPLTKSGKIDFKYEWTLISCPSDSISIDEWSTEELFEIDFTGESQRPGVEVGCLSNADKKIVANWLRRLNLRDVRSLK